MLDRVLPVTWTLSLTGYPAGSLGQAECWGPVCEVSPKFTSPLQKWKLHQPVTAQKATLPSAVEKENCSQAQRHTPVISTLGWVGAAEPGRAFKARQSYIVNSTSYSERKKGWGGRERGRGAYGHEGEKEEEREEKTETESEEDRKEGGKDTRIELWLALPVSPFQS